MANTYDPDGGILGTGALVNLTTAAPINLLQDFSYTTQTNPGSIGNLVWLDQNADGLFTSVDGPDNQAGTDDDEPAIGGVTVDLYRDLNCNGKIDAGDPRLSTETTVGAIDAGVYGSDGTYLFKRLLTTGNTVGNCTDGEAGYVVNVTDTAGVLAGYYWHSLGTANQDNNSQNDPYAVKISSGSPDTTRRRTSATT